MKARKVISLAIAGLIAFMTIPDISAKDFSEGFPSDWTKKTVGDADVTEKDGAIQIRVTGAAKKAASARVTTAPVNAEDNLYISIDFDINNADTDRKISISDGQNSADIAVINGPELRLMGEEQAAAEIETDNDKLHRLQIGIDKDKGYASAFLDGTKLYGAEYSEAADIDFSNVTVDIYTQIVMKETESLFTIYDYELYGYKTPEITLDPPEDRNVVTETDVRNITVELSSVADNSQRSISLRDEEGNDIEFTAEDSTNTLTITPNEGLKNGNRYFLCVSGIKDIYGNDLRTVETNFLVAPEGYIPPEADITAPLSGDEYYTGERVRINAHGSGDNLVGSELYIDGSLIEKTEKESIETYYTFDSAGTHDITFRACDNLGGYTEKRVDVSVIQNTAPDITILSPIDGQIFSAGDTIVLSAEAFDNDGKVSKVEWYENGRLIQTLTEAPYDTEITKTNSGSCLYTAVAYDNLGLSAEASAEILVENSSKKQILYNDYDNYKGSENPPNMEGVSTVNGGTYEAETNTDNNTACFKIGVSSNISGGGPFVQFKADAGGKIGLDTDIFVLEEGSIGASFSMRNSEKTIVSVSINNSSINIKNGDQNKSVPITRGAWHHIKYEFDTYKNEYDFWLDGEKIAESYKFGENTSFGILNVLRMTISGKESGIMLDNTEFYRYIESPYIVSFGYADEAGDIHTVSELPYDASNIYLKFNTAIGSVNSDAITYSDDNGNICNFESAVLSKDKLGIIAKIGTPLNSVATYKVNIGSDIVSEDGIKCDGVEFSFKVGAKPFDVIGCDILVNGRSSENAVLSKNDTVRAETEILNDTNEQKEALVIVILKKDNRTKKIYSFTKKLTAGVNTVTTDKIVAAEDGMTVNVLVWDGWQRRMPINNKIYN